MRLKRDLSLVCSNWHLLLYYGGFWDNLSDKEISQFVVTLIMPLFAFPFNGEFSLKDMVRVIVHTCSCMISIEQAAKRFKNAPKAPAIRFHSRRKLEIAWIEKAANKILQGLAKPILSGKCLEFAMDITFIPYHGKPKDDNAEVVRPKAKDGTTHFHAYATFYVILFGKRFTLALKYVKKGTGLRPNSRQSVKLALVCKYSKKKYN